MEKLVQYQSRNRKPPQQWKGTRTLILIRTCRCVPWPVARLHCWLITYCFALVQARLAEAEELKQEGNDLFRRSKWNEALQSYRNGLTRLPKRRDPPPPPPPPASSSSPQPPTTDDEGDSPLAEGEAPGASTDVKSQSEPSDCINVDFPLERECAKVRSVLHANIAACHLKLASAHTHSLKQVFDTFSHCRVKSRMPLKLALKVRIGHCDMNAPSKRTLSFAG